MRYKLLAPFGADGDVDFARSKLGYEDILELAPQMMRHGTAFRADAVIAVAKRVATGWYDNFGAMGVQMSVAEVLRPWLRDQPPAASNTNG